MILLASSLNENLVASNINLMLGKIYSQLGERDKSVTFIDKELTINVNNKGHYYGKLDHIPRLASMILQITEKLLKLILCLLMATPFLDIKLMKGDIQEVTNSIISNRT